MIVYADASALVKLVRSEGGTSALRRWIVRHRPEVTMSAIGVVELRRAAGRVSAQHVEMADEVLRAVNIAPVTDAVLALASAVGPPALRTLDAIHLATAVMIGDLDSVLCYDRRLGAAFERIGITVEAPTDPAVPEGPVGGESGLAGSGA